MDFFQFVVEQSLVLIPVLMILGKIIKSLPFIKNWLIPIVLLVPGVVGAVLIMGLSVQSVIQGILVTGAAVYGHQVFKQLSDKGEGKA